MLIAAPRTRGSPSPPRGISSAITIGLSSSIGITAAVVIPLSVMNHSWYAWSLAFGASPSQRTSQRCRTLSAKIVTEPTRPPVETGIWTSRVADPWMNVETVSSSAWTRATRPSRSVVSVPIVRYAHQAPPPPPITRVISAAAASGPRQRRRGASARASTRPLSSGRGVRGAAERPSQSVIPPSPSSVSGPPSTFGAPCAGVSSRSRAAGAAAGRSRGATAPRSRTAPRRAAAPRKGRRALRAPPGAPATRAPPLRATRPAAPVVLVDVTPHLHEHVAHHVLGLVFVLQNAKRQTQDPRCDKVEQLPERVRVPRLEAPLERALVLLTKTFRRGHLDCCPRGEPGRIQPRSCILKTRTRRWDVGSLPS